MVVSPDVMPVIGIEAATTSKNVNEFLVKCRQHGVNSVGELCDRSLAHVMKPGWGLFSFVEELKSLYVKMSDEERTQLAQKLASNGESPEEVEEQIMEAVG